MFTTKLNGALEVLTFTSSVARGADTITERHLQVRIGRAVFAAVGQAFVPPLPAQQCSRVLDIGRGMVGYAVGVTVLRRWHLSLTAERLAPGVRLADDIEGIDRADPVAA